MCQSYANINSSRYYVAVFDFSRQPTAITINLINMRVFLELFDHTA